MPLPGGQAGIGAVEHASHVLDSFKHRLADSRLFVSYTDRQLRNVKDIHKSSHPQNSDSAFKHNLHGLSKLPLPSLIFSWWTHKRVTACASLSCLTMRLVCILIFHSLRPYDQ